MRMILFSLFGFDVYSHGVFLVLGIVVAGFFMYRLLTKEKLNRSSFLYHYVASVIFGVVASRVIFYLFNTSLYNSCYQILEIWEGGLVSFAGFIIGGFSFYLLLRKKEREVEPIINLAGVAFPLGIAIGRIGCTLNGEVGIKLKSMIAYYGYMPVTAIEIFTSSLIFVIIFLIYLKFKPKLCRYSLFLLFIIFYSLSRIIIDGWRIDQKIFLGLNFGQLFSIIIFILSLIFLLKNRHIPSLLTKDRSPNEN